MLRELVTAMRPRRALAPLTALAIVATFVGAPQFPASAASAGATDDTPDVVQYVDPFVSTSGDHGNDLPGAEAPNGLAKVNPLTAPGRTHSGYDYAQKQIQGFTQTNLDGVGGSGGGGDLLVVPTTVNYTKRPATSSYAQTFSHDDETATPGYYQVRLTENAGTDGSVQATSDTVDAEMTATTRTSVQRYDFSGTSAPSLVLDLKNNFTQRTASSIAATKLADGRAALSGRFAGQFNGASYAMYYYAETSQPVKSVRTWGDDGSLTSATSQKGVDTGSVVTFDPQHADDVELRITLSPISVAQAKTDQAAELGALGPSGSLTFDQVRKQTATAWNDRLAEVDVTNSATSDPDGSLKKLFYTHLYRMLALPANATSTSGTYRGVDGVVHRARGHVHYDGWSTWDDLRKYSVLAYTYPDLYRDVVQSAVDLFADAQNAGGSKDLGSLLQSVPTVRWERTSIVIADALSKGYTGLDRLGQAYPALQRLVGSYTDDQKRLGYIAGKPADTVARGYDDWSMSIIAKALGRTDDAAEYLKEAAYPTKNLYKPGAWRASDGTKVNLLTPRDANGNWADVNYEQWEAGSVYQGTLWQYNWYNANDMAGLTEAMGGEHATRLAVDHMFGEDSSKDDGSTMLHSNVNEVDLQAPYLFNYVGEPSKTQKWVRDIYTKQVWNRYIATWNADGTENAVTPTGNGEFTPPIRTKVYSLDPQGFLPTMDNDAGTMSTMFVAAAIGLFPVTAGSSQYQIGTPFFDNTTIHYPGGKDFSVTADGVSGDDFYVQSATLNGSAFGNTWLDYRTMVRGGSLSFDMGATASSWGEHTAAPYSMSTASSDDTDDPAQYPVTADGTTIAAAADGTVAGTVELSLAGGATFAGDTDLTAAGSATVVGFPKGVTATVTRKNATTLTVTVTGTTTAPASFHVNLTDAALSGEATADQVDGDGLSARTPLRITTVSAAKSALQKLVDDVALVRPGNYTTASYSALTAAQARAKVDLADTSADDATIGSDQDTLQSAVDGLALSDGGLRRLEAEQSDSWSGGDLDNEAYNSSGNIGGVRDGAWVEFDGMSFRSDELPKTFTVRYATDYGSSDTPSRVEAHAGDASGPVVATATLPGTSGFGTYASASATVTDAAALAAAGKVTMVFKGVSGRDWVGNFDWFQFSAESTGATAVEPLTVANVAALGRGVRVGGGAEDIKTSGGIFENLLDGAWAEWPAQDLGSGVDSVTISYDKPRSRAASDSHVELHLGSADGPDVVDVPLSYTGDGWGTTGTVTAAVDPTVFRGTQTIYAVFESSTQTTALPYVANVNSIQFRRTPVSDTRIEAESSDANSGNGLKSEGFTWNDGTTGDDLGGTTDDSWLRYDDIDFGTQATTDVAVHYVNNSGRCGTDSRIEIYLDSFDPANPGDPFATVALPVTGSSWSDAGTATLHLPATIEGTHTVYLRLRSTTDSGHPYVANIDSLTFTHAVDTTALSAAVADTAGPAASTDRYDPIDAGVFLRERQAAMDLLADATATQDDVALQTRRLSLAADQLTPLPRLRLEVAVTAAAGLDLARYTEATRTAFTDALTTAQGVAADERATDDDLAGALTALQKAQDALEVKSDSAPDAPADVASYLSGRTLVVAWTAPADDGGRPVTGYVVTLDDGTTKTLTGATRTSATFSGLTRGRAYRAQVSAVNAIGTSAASAWTEPVTVAAVEPGAPTTLQLTAAVGTVTAHWQAPADDGGSPVTAYLVALDGGTPVRVPADTLRHTFTGAGTGDRTVSVRAVTAAGTSDVASARVAVPAPAPAPKPGPKPAAKPKPKVRTVAATAKVTVKPRSGRRAVVAVTVPRVKSYSGVVRLRVTGSGVVHRARIVRGKAVVRLGRAETRRATVRLAIVVRPQTVRVNDTLRVQVRKHTVHRSMRVHR